MNYQLTLCVVLLSETSQQRPMLSLQPHFGSASTWRSRLTMLPGKWWTCMTGWLECQPKKASKKPETSWRRQFFRKSIENSKKNCTQCPLHSPWSRNHIQVQFYQKSFRDHHQHHRRMRPAHHHHRRSQRPRRRPTHHRHRRSQRPRRRRPAHQRHRRSKRSRRRRPAHPHHHQRPRRMRPWRSLQKRKQSQPLLPNHRKKAQVPRELQTHRKNRHWSNNHCRHHPRSPRRSSNQMSSPTRSEVRKRWIWLVGLVSHCLSHLFSLHISSNLYISNRLNLRPRTRTRTTPGMRKQVKKTTMRCVSNEFVFNDNAKSTLQNDGTTPTIHLLQRDLSGSSSNDDDNNDDDESGPEEELDAKVTLKRKEETRQR